MIEFSHSMYIKIMAKFYSTCFNLGNELRFMIKQINIQICCHELHVNVPSHELADYFYDPNQKKRFRILNITHRFLYG